TAAQAGDHPGAAITRDGSGAHLRPDLHPHARRAWLCDRNCEPLYLSHGVPLLQLRIRRCDVLRSAGVHHGFRSCAAARNASAERVMKSAWRYAIASLALVAALAPIYWLATISLKKEIDQFAWPPLWWGFAPTFEHYRDAFIVRSFGRFLANS